MRNGRELAMQARASNCFKKTYSTEDLWNEDSYIPEHIGSFHEFHYTRFIGKWKKTMAYYGRILLQFYKDELVLDYFFLQFLVYIPIHKVS